LPLLCCWLCWCCCPWCSYCLCFAVYSADGDVIDAVGVLWFPTDVIISAVDGVPAIAVVPSTGVSTTSGVLLSEFPNVPVVSCAGEGLAARVVLTAVDVPEMLAVATMLLLPSLVCWRPVPC
jgi:hypothetical protein